VRVPHDVGYLYQPGGTSSRDGHCRAFDEAATGSVVGSGTGVVVLRRLTDAIADGDEIRALVLGSATNNDGGRKAGFTAPSVDGQARVVREAMAAAGVDPASVGYVECHGTGTPLGDPIEVAGLTRAFRSGTDATGFCGIGSVKTNIGHLDAAAGIAGLIKTVLALEHRQVPPSLNCDAPSSRIDFAHSPFYVNTELRPWPAGAGPRRAAVSSIGMGGVNAHVILQEAPARAPAAPARPVHLLTLSARSPAALSAMRSRLAEHLAGHPEQALADVAHTLHVGRRPFEYRHVARCADREQALAELRGDLDSATVPLELSDRPVVLMFPGQGSQYLDMARGIYQTEPLFREELDRCAAWLAEHEQLDPRELAFAGVGADVRAASRLLGETRAAQPAIFSVSYALARLWQSWGVTASAMIGHSVGEYVAACVAGVFDLEDALRLVARRGRLIQALPSGAMLSVALDEEELRGMLPDDLSLAAVNSPRQCVAGGPREAIAEFQEALAEQGVPCQRLYTSHAFHTPMVAPACEPLAALVASVERRPPAIPFVSNVTGTWITDGQAVDPWYWAEHLRRPVRFAEGLETLLAEPSRLLIECGPGQVLTGLARQPGASGAGRHAAAISSMRTAQDRRPDAEVLADAVGRLWLAGVHVDWTGYHARERRRRVRLPAYPFEREQYWMDPPARQVPAQPAPAGTATPVEATGEPPPRPSPLDAAPSAQLHPRPDLLTPYVAPREGAERRVAEVWMDVIGVDRVGANDGLLELGADSLMATQILARLWEVFGVQLPMEELFAASNVAGVARALDGAEPAGAPAEVAQGEDIADLEAILRDLDGLSDEEVEARLQALDSEAGR
jgi:acyl transferase domain-containing protein